MAKFYVTTAIDYPSSKPHLGHAYEKVCADVIARWHRLLGEDVFFSTGLDCHGLKIQKAAEKAGIKPEAFVEANAKFFIELCSSWNISYDRFIRTTEKGHEKIVQDIFQKIYDKGDIYKGKYEGLYCTDCEAYYLEKDLANGCCPVHKGKCDMLKEDSHFFKLSKYKEQIVKHITDNPEFIQPEGKRIEILNRLKEPLRDLSVSRLGVSWGIPTPIDKKFTVYVWLEALLNYISVLGYPGKTFEKYWPADIHLIGLDVNWFHSVIWPAVLFSAGIPLPKTVFVHGFINLPGGQKMSKSAGTVVDPLELAKKYNVDALRYFLLREIPFGHDSVFSEEALKERANNELANELGNLLNRTLVMIEKYHKGKIPEAKADEALAGKLKLEKIKEHLDALEFHFALNDIFAFIAECNKYINDKAPWKLKGKELGNVLYSLADSLRVISILLSPFVPETSAKINKQLGVKVGKFDECRFNLLKAGTKTAKGEILFRKVN